MPDDLAHFARAQVVAHPALALFGFEQGVVVRRDADEEVDRGGGCSGGGAAAAADYVGSGGGGGGGGARGGGGGCGVGGGLVEVEGLLEAGEEVAGFDEFVEEIVVGVGIGQEGVAGRDGESEAGEKGVEEGTQIRMLGYEVLGIGGEEAEEGEEALPEEGPVVLESGSGEGEVGEETVDDSNTGYVQGKVESPPEIVVYGVDQDVEN